MSQILKPLKPSFWIDIRDFLDKTALQSEHMFVKGSLECLLLFVEVILPVGDQQTATEPSSAPSGPRTTPGGHTCTQVYDVLGQKKFQSLSFSRAIRTDYPYIYIY